MVAVLNENNYDSVGLHVSDTVKAGAGLNIGGSIIKSLNQGNLKVSIYLPNLAD